MLALWEQYDETKGLPANGDDGKTKALFLQELQTTIYTETEKEIAAF
jgi:hypothetical protein